MNLFGSEQREITIHMESEKEMNLKVYLFSEYSYLLNVFHFFQKDKV